MKLMENGASFLLLLGFICSSNIFGIWRTHAYVLLNDYSLFLFLG